ncbi:hypothetical protein SLE2022_294660 [Rubroshorea leprosula]
MSPPSYGTAFVGGTVGNKQNYIKHQVSKMDTLAGVAIKYGVEVADIKRLNGLSADLQMFALKTLLIPLPGRHPPSSSFSSASSASVEENGWGKRENGCRKISPHIGQSNILESFQPRRLKPPKQKVSPAMSTLQKFYGLKTPNHKGASEGTEMAVYGTGSLDFLSNGLIPKASPLANNHSDQHRKSRNLGNGFLPENEVNGHVPLAEAGEGEGERSSEKSVRRRQKAEADFKAGTPERLMKEENGGGSSGFSPIIGKGLAMRTKSASRPLLTAESDSGWLNPIPVGLGDSIIPDGLGGVRKSSSTPALQEQENGHSSSVWTTSKWSLKPDLQALSTAAITIPLFDGLPNPIAGRRSKAALD